MSSSKGKARQRELARAKYERQLARRAASIRRRRQLWSGVAVLVVVVAGFGIALLTGVFDSEESTATTPDPPAPSSSSSSPVDESSDDATDS